MSGSNDWWLKKLLKMDRALVEQRDELVNLRAELAAVRDKARNAYAENHATVNGLLERIKQMAPERQFRVVWNGPGTVKLGIDAVSSANGVTTITVNRVEPLACAAIRAKIRARS